MNPVSDDDEPDSDEADDDHSISGSTSLRTKKKPTGGAGPREISVSARRTDDGSWQGTSLSDVRLEIIAKAQSEREASWLDLEYRGIEVCNPSCLIVAVKYRLRDGMPERRRSRSIRTIVLDRFGCG